MSGRPSFHGRCSVYSVSLLTISRTIIPLGEYFESAAQAEALMMERLLVVRSANIFYCIVFG